MLDEMKYSGEFPLERKGYAFLLIMENGSSEDKKMLSQGAMNEQDWYSLLAKYNVTEQLVSMLNQSVERVQTLIQECNGEQQKSEIKHILHQIMDMLSPQRHSFQ
ncbi:hypothetical protein D3C73_1194730 [compost metagenome]